MSYLLAIAAIVGLMIFWYIIQHLWRITFIDHQTNKDVLADRSACGSCGCGTSCENKQKVENQKQ